MSANVRQTDTGENPRPRDPREARRSGKIRRITPYEVLLVVKIMGLLVITWLVPQRFWPALSVAIVSVTSRLGARQTRAASAHIEQIIGDCPVSKDPVRIVIETMVANWYDQMQILGDLRPGGWSPEVRLHGSGHLEAALARGRGAILWVGDFANGRLVAKMAFHRAGYRVCHLSRPTHGFSRRPFAERFLNPLWARVENRYLAERVVIENDRSVAPLRALRRRLRENGVVSITVGREARQPVVVPLLRGRIRLATGAVGLAMDAGAPLLPVFTVRNDAGEFEVHITSPLNWEHDAPREERIRATLTAYAGHLEQWVSRWPGLWRGWHKVALAGEPFADAEFDG